jgi:hypothetical protein
MILIGLDSSSRHSSHSTPTSAGRWRHTGHITTAVYHQHHHQARPGDELPQQLPGPIAAAYDAAALVPANAALLVGAGGA